MSESRSPTIHDWTKSSYSSSTGGECVEWSPTSAAQGLVPVRDSKAPNDPRLTVTATAWTSFINAIRTGELAD